MKKFNNEILFKKWVKLLLFINKGDYYYQKLREEDRTISTKNEKNILEKQINLLKKRIPKMKNVTINQILNFSFVIDMKYKYEL